VQVAKWGKILPWQNFPLFVYLCGILIHFSFRGRVGGGDELVERWDHNRVIGRDQQLHGQHKHPVPVREVFLPHSGTCG